TRRSEVRILPPLLIEGQGLAATQVLFLCARPPPFLAACTRYPSTLFHTQPLSASPLTSKLGSFVRRRISCVCGFGDAFGGGWVGLGALEKVRRSTPALRWRVAANLTDVPVSRDAPAIAGFWVRVKAIHDSIAPVRRPLGLSKTGGIVPPGGVAGA